MRKEGRKEGAKDLFWFIFELDISQQCFSSVELYSAQHVPATSDVFNDLLMPGLKAAEAEPPVCKQT